MVELLASPVRFMYLEWLGWIKDEEEPEHDDKLGNATVTAVDDDDDDDDDALFRLFTCPVLIFETKIVIFLKMNLEYFK